MSSKTLLTMFSFSHRLFEHTDCGFGSLAVDSCVSSGLLQWFHPPPHSGFLAPGILQDTKGCDLDLAGCRVCLSAVSLPEPCPEIWRTSLETVASSRSSVGSSRPAWRVWGFPGGPLVKNLLANAGDAVLDPCREDP